MDITPNAFRKVNQFMVLLWRAGLGRVLNATHRQTGRVLVLAHQGRKSGLRRLTPLNYAPEPEAVVCLAGFGLKTDWLRNVRAHPEVELWLPGERREAWAEMVKGKERLPLLRQVLQNSGFAAETLAGIDPWTISDEDLSWQTADYAVVRFHLGDPVHGPGGPGDLALPAALLALAGASLGAWALYRGCSRCRARDEESG